jgi:protein SCO1
LTRAKLLILARRHWPLTRAKLLILARRYWQQAASGTHASEIRVPRAACPPVPTAVAVLFALVLLTARMAPAQIPPPPVNAGTSADVTTRVGIDQKLASQVPLDAVFRDETGRTITLREYFHPNKPVVLALVYYECPMLCTMTLNGMSASFKPLNFSAGKEFEVVTISINPRETPQQAAAKKASYLKVYNRAGAENGWHFLTGDESQSKLVADAVGFRYFYDEKSKQYAHASGIMLLTPEGKVSRYFYGLEYSARDLRLGVVEASENKVGSLAEQVMLLCFHYDPMSGKYGFYVMGALRVGAVLLVLSLTTFILFSVRRDRRNRTVPVATTTTTTTQRP